MQRLQRSHGNRAALSVLQAKRNMGMSSDPAAQDALTVPPQAPHTDRANDTGLPNNLKAGVERLSGISLENVKVHYNSSKPAQLDALAYAQGAEIHVAPGQEQYLPHEAWHVVQQAQGRVKPTMQLKEGVPVNDEQGLEQEADVMGMRASSVAPAIHLAEQLDHSSNQKTAGAFSPRPIHEDGKQFPTASFPVKAVQRGGKSSKPVESSKNLELIDAFYKVAGGETSDYKQLKNRLMELTGLDEKAIDVFLNKDVIYFVQGVETIPKSRYNHALIRIPDDNETIEWAFMDQVTKLPEEGGQALIQQETRSTKRSQIAKMIRAATKLAHNKVHWRNTEIYKGWFIFIYVPYINDCFTYVSQVLEAAEEPKLNIKHNPKNAPFNINNNKNGKPVVNQENENTSNFNSHSSNISNSIMEQKGEPVAKQENEKTSNSDSRKQKTSNSDSRKQKTSNSDSRKQKTSNSDSRKQKTSNSILMEASMHEAEQNKNEDERDKGEDERDKEKK